MQRIAHLLIVVCNNLLLSACLPLALEPILKGGIDLRLLILVAILVAI